MTGWRSQGLPAQQYIPATRRFPATATEQSTTMRFIHEVTVRAAVNGTRQALTFPMDMLRYDMLAPRSGPDVEVITSSLVGEEEECYCPKQPERWPTVKLVRE